MSYLTASTFDIVCKSSPDLLVSRQRTSVNKQI